MPTKPQTALPIALLLLGAPAFSASAPHPPVQDDIEAVLEKSAELMKRIPARYHIRGYEALANAKDARAIAVLRKAYSKPAFPKDESPFLVASAVGEKGSGKRVLEELSDWLKDEDEPHDAWLWRNVLKIEIDHLGPERALEIARTSKEIVHRAAAIEALAAEKEESLFQLIPELCKALPEKDIEKTILMSAMVTALAELGNKKTRVKDDWQNMAFALIGTMEDEKTPRSAQLMLARHLTAELDADRMVLEPDAWRSLLASKAREAKDKKKKPKKEKEGASVVVWPTFFGVEVTGDRVCYVIDLSDSMAYPIPENWKPANGPTSGPSKRKKLKKGEVPTEKDIPWWTVKTRFDLAREHLRVSLLRMTPDQKFSVIGFGSKADFIDGCNGMVKASPSNIKKVLKALDAIEVGSSTPKREHGTLWGDTNLYDGLRLAFSATKKGTIDGDPYINYEAMEHGADTILLLSDGNPTRDNFMTNDVDYGDGGVTSDAEGGKREDTRTARLIYKGPYGNWRGLLSEIRRVNMLREVQIQVISVGDGDRQPLGKLAAIGQGKLTNLGKKK